MDQAMLDWLSTGDPMGVLGDLAKPIYAAIRHELKHLPTFSPKAIHGSVIARMMISHNTAELTEEQWEIADAAVRIIADRISVFRSERQRLHPIPLVPSLCDRSKMERLLVRWAVSQGWKGSSYEWLRYFNRTYFEYSDGYNMLVGQLEGIEGRYIWAVAAVIRRSKLELVKVKLEKQSEGWVSVDTRLLEIY